MKKILLTLVMMVMMYGATAGVRYFTYSQASRTATYLNQRSELLIYWAMSMSWQPM